MKRLMFKALPVLLLSAAFVACDKDDDTPVPVEEKAKIAIVHASPGAPEVDVYLDSASLTSSQIAYGDFTGTAGNPYVEVDAGQQLIRITNDGTTNFYEGSVNLEKDKSYSLFVYDVPENGNVKTVLLEDALLRLEREMPICVSYILLRMPLLRMFSGSTMKEIPLKLTKMLLS